MRNGTAFLGWTFERTSAEHSRSIVSRSVRGTCLRALKCHRCIARSRKRQRGSGPSRSESSIQFGWPGCHALLVEPVPVIEPDRERVVADPAVEPRVEPAPHATSCVRRELVAEEHRNVTESRAPLGRLFSRDQKDDGKPPAQAIAEQVDDPGVEEHADRELVGENEPGSLHVRTPSCAAMRPASEAPSSRWKRSTSSGVPHAGQPSTP